MIKLVLHHWFAHPWAFWLLMVLPTLATLGLFALRRRKRTLGRMGSRPALQVLARDRRWPRVIRPMIWLAGIGMLVAGLAGPQWGTDLDQLAAPVRDVVVVIDLSRSMLAQDVLPDRATRARQAILDLSFAIERQGGYRIGLVAFAARAKMFCPLTHDYDHFRLALNDLDAEHLHPDLRAIDKDAVSGTRMGAGILAGIDLHDGRFRGFQDILLLSDGDDPAGDGEWREAALAAKRHKIPLHTIGIGDPDNGSQIPGTNGSPMRYEGELVITRLIEKPLEEMAHLTGGTYTPARTSTLRMGQLFRERIESGAVRDEDEESLPVPRQHYAWFLGGALAIFGLEMAVGRHRPRLAVSPAA